MLEQIINLNIHNQLLEKQAILGFSLVFMFSLEEQKILFNKEINKNPKLCRIEDYYNHFLIKNNNSIVIGRINELEKNKDENYIINNFLAEDIKKIGVEELKKFCHQKDIHYLNIMKNLFPIKE
jgi:hypothetical protein